MARSEKASDRASRFPLGLAVLLMLPAGFAPSVRGEPAMTEVAALARPYGAGVHAYFSGDVQRAYDDLTQAIEAGTRDPRAWYFRGLAALKLGRLDEAEADFSTGADRETAAEGDWAVARSLERVQGRDRLALERHRVRARVAGLRQQRQQTEWRYLEDITSREDEVQRKVRPEGVGPDPTAKFGEPLPSEPGSLQEPVESTPPAEPVAPAEPEPTMEAEDAAKAAPEAPAAAGDSPAAPAEPLELPPARTEEDEAAPAAETLPAEPADREMAEDAADAAEKPPEEPAAEGEAAGTAEKDADAAEKPAEEPAEGEAPDMAEKDADSAEKPADEPAAE